MKYTFISTVALVLGTLNSFANPLDLPDEVSWYWGDACQGGMLAIRGFSPEGVEFCRNLVEVSS